MAVGAKKLAFRPIVSGDTLRFGRLLVFAIPLVLTLANYILESRFTNWEFLAPNLAVLGVGFALHTVYVFLDGYLSKHERIHFLTFVIDSALLSLLILWTGVDQSFYLFLYLILVLVCGLELRTWYAVTLALLVSIEFTTLSMLFKNLTGIQFLFFVVINDVSLFIVAFLAGYLAENLKETSVSLADLRKLNSFIVESSPLGLLTLNSNLDVLQINPSMQAFLLGKSVQTFLHQVQNVLSVGSLREGAPYNFEFKFSSDGEERIFKGIATRRWSEQLEDNLVLLSLEDQTQMKKLEWDLQQKEKLAAVGQLAAGIAHEIRNPLASMSGSIEMLSQQTSNEDDRKLMKIILREIDRLNNLITEFLDYSRPAKKPTDLISVSQVLHETVEALRFHAAFTPDIEINMNIEPELRIPGFPDKLKQAFLNVIINSLQALSERPVKKLLVEAKGDGQNIQVIVEDSGSGMSAENLRKMFEPFHTTKSKGTGLGLAITHKIIESHGGQVFVTSELGKGTRFEMKFPC